MEVSNRAREYFLKNPEETDDEAGAKETRRATAERPPDTSTRGYGMSVTRVKTSHCGGGGRGLAGRSGTCDWSFVEIRVFFLLFLFCKVIVTKAGRFIDKTTTAVVTQLT